MHIAALRYRSRAVLHSEDSGPSGVGLRPSGILATDEASRLLSEKISCCFQKCLLAMYITIEVPCMLSPPLQSTRSLYTFRCNDSSGCRGRIRRCDCRSPRPNVRQATLPVTR